MKKLLAVAIAVLTIGTASTAQAGFAEGQDAYNKKNWKQVIIELRPLAEAGDDRAMMLIGNMYNEGFGVIKSPSEAINLYKRAAILNNTEAMLSIAAMYTSGIGVQKNMNTALKWFERAALLDNQVGAFFYATILYRGNNSPADDIKPDHYNAYKWYKIVAISKKFPKFSNLARDLALAMTKDKISAADSAKADKEALEWKPVDPATLGPIPPDPQSIKKVEIPKDLLNQP
jgi:hypothetical protein